MGFTVAEDEPFASGGGGGGAAVMALNMGIFLPPRPNDEAPAGFAATAVEGLGWLIDRRRGTSN